MVKLWDATEFEDPDSAGRGAGDRAARHHRPDPGGGGRGGRPDQARADVPLPHPRRPADSDPAAPDRRVGAATAHGAGQAAGAVDGPGARGGLRAGQCARLSQQGGPGVHGGVGHQPRAGAGVERPDGALGAAAARARSGAAGPVPRAAGRRRPVAVRGDQTGPARPRGQASPDPADRRAHRTTGLTPPRTAARPPHGPCQPGSHRCTHEQDTALAGACHRLGGTADGLGGHDGALHRPAHLDQCSAGRRLAETVDHQRVPAGDGRAAARRGHAWRPHRPQADVPHRPGPVRSRLPPGRVRPLPAGTDRRPGLPRGRGRGDAARHRGTDPHHLRRRTRARHRHRHLGHHGGTRRRTGPDRRRPAAPALLVGLGLPPQHPRRAARPGRDDRPWDLIASLQAMVALVGLVYAVQEATKPSPMPLAILLALLAAAAGSFTFVRRQRRQTYPLIDFSLFRNRSLLTGVITAALAMAATAGIQLLLTQRLQLILGLTPLHAGLIVTAFATGSLPVGALAGSLLHRTGVRPLIGGGLLLGALGVLVTLLLTPGAGPLLGGGRSPAWVVPGLVLAGAGLGIVMVAASAAIIGGAPAHRAGMASSVESASYELGSLAGVTILGTVLTAVYANTVHLPATAPAQAGGSIDEARAAAGRLPAGQAHALMNAAASAFDNGYTLALAIATVALAAGSAFTYRHLTRQPTAATEQAQHPEPAQHGR